MPASIDRLISVLMNAGARKVLKLQVSGAFHSRYMKPVQVLFAKELESIEFKPPVCKVISNRYGKPYEVTDIKQTLLEQISHPVLLEKSILYVLEHGAEEYFEAGPDNSMKNMVKNIKKELMLDENTENVTEKENILGSRSFKEEYETSYAYVVGGIRDGISSVTMMKSLEKGNILGFLGTKGLSLQETQQIIESALREVKQDKLGVHITCDVLQPEYSDEKLQLIIKYNINRLQISGFQKPTEKLYEYRIHNIRQRENASDKLLVCVNNRKATEEFMKPIPKYFIQMQMQLGNIDSKEAEFLSKIPLCDDICIENDGLGVNHFGWISSFKKLNHDMSESYGMKKRVRIGICGNIGNPQMLAVAFFSGADFVMTSTINQCTLEADTSERVKELLQEAKENDFLFAPTDNLFEFGEKKSILKKGTLYAVRAQKVYDIYLKYSSLEEIPDEQEELLEYYFGISLEQMYQSIVRRVSNREKILIGEQPKYKLGVVLKEYLQLCFIQVKIGEKDWEINYGIEVGSELADMNRWLEGTDLETWKQRKVTIIAKRMMDEGADLLKKNCQLYI